MTSFKSPLKFTQGNKGTGDAGREHTAGKSLQWKYNFTVLRPPASSFFTQFPKIFKAKTMHAETKEPAGARNSTLSFVETTVQVAPEMLVHSGVDLGGDLLGLGRSFAAPSPGWCHARRCAHMGH